MNLFHFFYDFENTIFEKKNRSYNRATVSSITRKILVCDMEFSISKIRRVTFIFQNYFFFFKKRKGKLKKLGSLPKAKFRVPTYFDCLITNMTMEIGTNDIFKVKTQKNLIFNVFHITTSLNIGFELGLLLLQSNRSKQSPVGHS